jgi:hypothetical protein
MSLKVVRTGFLWLRIGFYEHGKETLGFHKIREIPE